MSVDYPSNSFRDREEEQQSLEKPVIREGSARKKSEFLKIVDFILSDDRVEPPTFIQNATRVVRRASRLIGIFDEILEPNRGYSNNRSNGRTRYRSFYDDGGRDRDDRDTRREPVNVYDELDYDTARDAEDVLFSMKDTIRDYGIVTVANYYEFSRVRGDNIQFTRYGWTNLNGVGIHKTWNGRWVIDLPRPMPIDERR